jgi:glycosyltransferase involved in cell wall biosynthesis
MNGPSISLVVVVYNIPREAPRTLYSLSAAYQQQIDPTDYEIIVVDNGSKPAFDAGVLAGLTGNFRLIRIDDASPSPVMAINRGLAAAKGDVIGVMIDGARMVTPRLLHFARHATGLFETAVVSTLGWYIGSDFQRYAMESGYNKAEEDALLERTAWQEDGYRLYEISTLDESSSDGWFQPIAETNCLFMHRRNWQALSGLDERFDMPGGGLANLDTYARAMALPGAEPVVLLGEATFHQLHGGVATNSTPEQISQRYREWDRNYASIRGHSYQWPKRNKPPTYLGSLPRAELQLFTRAAIAPWGSTNTIRPLGDTFDARLWSFTPPCLPADPRLGAAVLLAHQEFLAGRIAAAISISRLIRKHSPNEPEPQRLLRIIGPASDIKAQENSPEYLAALGDAYSLLNDRDQAAAHYRRTLEFDPLQARARMGMARLRLPGERYYCWVEHVRNWLHKTFPRKRKVCLTSGQ